MGCDDEKLSKYLTHTFMAHCHTMICQQVTLSGAAEWPKVAGAMIEAAVVRLLSAFSAMVSQLPCLGVERNAMRRTSARACSGANAS